MDKAYSYREMFGPISNTLAAMLEAQDRKCVLKEYNSNSYLYQKRVDELLSPSSHIPLIISAAQSLRADVLRCAAVFWEHLDRKEPDVQWVYRNTSDEYGGTFSYPSRETVVGLVRIMEKEGILASVQKLMDTLKGSVLKVLTIFMVGVFVYFPEDKPEEMKLQILRALYRKYHYYFTPSLPALDGSQRNVYDYLSAHCFLPEKAKIVNDFTEAWTKSKRDRQAHPKGRVNNIWVEPMWITCGAAEYGGVRLDSLLGDNMVSKSLLQQLQENAFWAFEICGQKKDQADEAIEGWYVDSEEKHVLQNLYDNGLMTALFVRLLAEKYVAEVKLSIKREIYGKGSSQRNDNEAGAVMRKMESKLREANDVAQRAVRAKNDAETLLMQAKKREAALIEKLENIKNELSRQQAMWLDRTVDCNENFQEEETEEDDDTDEAAIDASDMDYTELLRPIFQRYTVVFVGGNTNLMKKFRVRNPDAVIVDKCKVATCDQTIAQADALLFKTDSMSHVQYNKCKAIARRSNVPIGYISNIASVELMESEIYHNLVELLRLDTVS